MKKVAILQSAYIPWKGYFDLIRSVDEFILYDDVQYSKGDWRNRNRIKTLSGSKWITIPVNLSGVWPLPIDNVVIADANWNSKHWDFIKQSFRGASAYRDGINFLEPLYAKATDPLLTNINELFIRRCCEYLGINTVIRRSTEYNLESTEKKSRLIELCLKANADCYVSGPAGKIYLEEKLFHIEGLSLEYFDYSAYKTYRQLHGQFEHKVSIIDLIFNLGSDAKNFLRSSY